MKIIINKRGGVFIIPDTNVYNMCLEQNKGYYCEDKIAIKKELKTQVDGYRKAKG